MGQRSAKAQPGATNVALGGSPRTATCSVTRRPLSRGAAASKRARIGMRGRGEHGLGRPRLDDAAEIHDRHPVREALDDGQVVGNEQVGEGESFPQIQQ